MRSQEHIGNNRLRHQLRLLRVHARVHIVADVAVRPAIEAAIFHRSEVLRRKIVAEAVAFIDTGPELAGYGFERDSDRVTQAGGVQPRILAIGIAYGNGSAARVALDIDVRCRTDAHEKMVAVRAETERPRRVTSAR